LTGAAVERLTASSQTQANGPTSSQRPAQPSPRAAAYTGNGTSFAAEPRRALPAEGPATSAWSALSAAALRTPSGSGTPAGFHPPGPPASARGSVTNAAASAMPAHRP